MRSQPCKTMDNRLSFGKSEIRCDSLGTVFVREKRNTRSQQSLEFRRLGNSTPWIQQTLHPWAGGMLAGSSHVLTWPVLGACEEKRSLFFHFSEDTNLIMGVLPLGSHLLITFQVLFIKNTITLKTGLSTHRALGVST